MMSLILTMYPHHSCLKAPFMSQTVLDQQACTNQAKDVLSICQHTALYWYIQCPVFLYEEMEDLCKLSGKAVQRGYSQSEKRIFTF